MKDNSYNHVEVEKKWQKHWSDNKYFEAKVDHSKPKYYILDMFPYPSGAGLHVGHVTGYTATDILARYKRQRGFNVLHPMAWDSFGLPAEQYAIRTGTHPRITTEKSINTYRKQLQSVGFSYDWSREFATSDSKYYKWTQWLFTKLYERGLAYEANVEVNYCPHLGTVLSNEEVEDGKSKEGGYLVERKPLKQWILKITEYAERLNNDLDTLDWPDYLKKIQRNWIGRSEGVNVDFKVDGHDANITTFTTRVDTIFGVSYLVLAPKHPLLESICSEDRKTAVEEYKKQALQKTDLERTSLNKDKTGVWTGAFAINPVDGSNLPIWVADYVLSTYGTGAVMGVPAHDERDFEFATKYGLSIPPVKDIDFTKLSKVELKNKSPEEARELYLLGEFFTKQEGPMINSSSDMLDLNSLSKEKAIEKATQWLEESKCGERKITYKLRDWLFSRQRYWAEPFPILHFEDGSKRVLGLDELPLIPPELSDFKPIGGGRSPLEKVPEWVNITDEKTGKTARRETNTMPQWAGSCWYYLRLCDAVNEKEAWSKEAEKYWMPVDLYVGGVEHAVLHLLYSRFWHKVFFDIGLVSTDEPFQSLRNQGLLTSEAYKLDQGGYVPPEDIERKEDQVVQKSTGKRVTPIVEKMSKSKLNGVAPDEIIQEFGADTLRLYEMFMAPFDKEKVWNRDAIHGCHRFLSRVYDLVTSDRITQKPCLESLKLSHKLVNGVIKDIESMQFNTAIAKMMEFLNAFSKLENYSKEALIYLMQVLYPFAPHFSEECHELLGEKESLVFKPLPKVNKEYLEETSTTYVVQVNGKVRAKFDIAKDQSKKDIIDYAKKLENIQKHLEGKDVLKEIFVPNKLLNFVVR